MPQRKQHEVPVTVFVPPAMAQRMERIAPTADGARSRFVRKAIEAALDRAEREQAGSAA